jgi:hypothetical protein
VRLRYQCFRIRVSKAIAELGIIIVILSSSAAGIYSMHWLLNMKYSNQGGVRKGPKGSAAMKGMFSFLIFVSILDGIKKDQKNMIPNNLLVLCMIQRKHVTPMRALITSILIISISYWKKKKLIYILSPMDLSHQPRLNASQICQEVAKILCRRYTIRLQAPNG